MLKYFCHMTPCNITLRFTNSLRCLHIISSSAEQDMRLSLDAHKPSVLKTYSWEPTEHAVCTVQIHRGGDRTAPHSADVDRDSPLQSTAALDIAVVHTTCRCYTLHQRLHKSSHTGTVCKDLASYVLGYAHIMYTIFLLGRGHWPTQMGVTSLPFHQL